MRDFLKIPYVSANASFYYGSFSPNIQLSGFLKALTSLIWPTLDEKAVQDLVDRIWSLLGQSLESLPSGFKQQMVKWVVGFLQAFRSWNHAKIFAVNGKHLVSGGANFWEPYSTSIQLKPLSVFDLSMKITGDAAIDAHKFANYFWQYLNHIPCTDNVSWCWGKRPNETFSKGAKAPIFDESRFPPNDGNVKALFTGKNGNWPRQHTGFPLRFLMQ